ncbi:MAG: hypothetical protein WD696_05190 [Bryobacteraceae bacterium]
MAQRKPTTEKTKKLDINPVTGFPRGSIEDKIRQIGMQIPEEAWEGLPDDWAENFHHYLHGTPRR